MSKFILVVVTMFCIFTSMREQWKDIKGYEGKYQASNLGGVKSVDRIVISKDGVKMPFKETVMKGYVSSTGYKQVKLRKPNGKRSNFTIHRLVADTWLDKGDLNVVNHLNGNKLDNRASNLEWTTHKGNANHAINTGLNKGVFDGKYVIDISNGFCFESISMAAIAYNIDRTCLSDRLNGKRFNETNLRLI